jgi:hypothetical protein
MSEVDYILPPKVFATDREILLPGDDIFNKRRLGPPLHIIIGDPDTSNTSLPGNVVQELEPHQAAAIAALWQREKLLWYELRNFRRVKEPVLETVQV